MVHPLPVCVPFCKAASASIHMTGPHLSGETEAQKSLTRRWSERNGVGRRQPQSHSCVCHQSSLQPHPANLRAGESFPLAKKRSCCPASSLASLAQDGPGQVCSAGSIGPYLWRSQIKARSEFTQDNSEVQEKTLSFCSFASCFGSPGPLDGMKANEAES